MYLILRSHTLSLKMTDIKLTNSSVHSNLMTALTEVKEQKKKWVVLTVQLLENVHIYFSIIYIKSSISSKITKKYSFFYITEVFGKLRYLRNYFSCKLNENRTGWSHDHFLWATHHNWFTSSRQSTLSLCIYHLRKKKFCKCFTRTKTKTAGNNLIPAWCIPINVSPLTCSDNCDFTSTIIFLCYHIVYLLCNIPSLWSSTSMTGLY